ncbi:MAG: DUF1460 domain-containing protein [Deltaproteobacteria bacterium]|nr:DUF1460 domain-containing protein [Deltaproteobacteria bacterium]
MRVFLFGALFFLVPAQTDALPSKEDSSVLHVDTSVVADHKRSEFFLSSKTWMGIEGKIAAKERPERRKNKKEKHISKPRRKSRKKFTSPKKVEIEDVIQHLDASQTLADRLRLVSDAFIGAPYASSPLGEGSGQDADPRMRFDAFDCTTFVETAMAMSMSNSLGESEELIDVIRYQSSEILFENRRHFPAAEWLPQLTKLGFLSDITREIAGDETVVEKKVLNAKVWEKRKKPTVLELPNERIPDGIFALEVWPLDLARKRQLEIPPGTLLNLVRVDFKRIPVRVSHQGLVIKKSGALYMRHAADRMYHSVVDEPLDHFLHRMQQYRKWPVRGIHLSRIQVPDDLPRLLQNKKGSEEHPEKDSCEARKE